MAELILAGLFGLLVGMAIGVWLGYLYNLWFIAQAVKKGVMKIFQNGRWYTKEDYGKE